MKENLIQKNNRRQILVGFMRYFTLGLIGAMGGSIFARRRRLIREDKCISKGICSGCEVFEKCGLPQALSAKEVLAGKDNGGK